MKALPVVLRLQPRRRQQGKAVLVRAVCAGRLRPAKYLRLAAAGLAFRDNVFAFRDSAGKRGGRVRGARAVAAARALALPACATSAAWHDRVATAYSRCVSHEKAAHGIPETDALCRTRRRQGRRVAALASRRPDAEVLSAGLVAARPGRGAGTDHHADAGRHRLRRGLRRARRLRALRHHGPAAGLRLARAEPDPGAGAGFGLGRAVPRRDPAGCWRRSGARRPGGQHDGGGLGRGLHRDGAAAPRLRRRTVVQADPLRLYERHRPDRADQPVAQAVRHPDRGCRPAA
ncbi:hypothetical protein D3C81_1378900 [compost metagenome]